MGGYFMAICNLSRLSYSGMLDFDVDRNFLIILLNQLLTKIFDFEDITVNRRFHPNF